DTAHIDRIADQTKAQITKMHTNLMGTTSFQTRLNTGEMLETLFDVVMGYRILTTWQDSHLNTIHRMTFNRLINGATGNNFAVNHQIIHTVDAFLGQLLA